jgi:hypothetical protein
MAQSKHRRKGARRLPRHIEGGGRTAIFSEQYRAQRPAPGTVMPTERELRDALGSIPEDFSWDWARLRLTPLFERADGGVDGDPTINTASSLGVAIGFGVEIGPTFARVTRSMATRWEASTEQIEASAFSHLADVVRGVGSRDLQHAVHKGYMTRCLPQPGGWASSAILAGEDEVRRIFGSHDQVFTTPSRNMILSFDATVPMHAILDMTTLFEDADPHPLLLDPFVLRDGRLSWAGLVLDDGDEPLP